jgi:hypothetical protein
MKVGIIGTGHVGRALATGLARAKHEVSLGSRNPAIVEPITRVGVGSRKEAADWAEVVILAVPFPTIRETVRAIGPNALNRKVLVDATNAIAESGEWALGFSTSGAEELAKLCPGARVVKAFNTVFAHLMSEGRLGGEPITLLMAGDDAAAKQAVAQLGRDLGFDPVDAGPLRSARYLEPLALQMIQLAYVQKMGADLGLRLLRKP